MTSDLENETRYKMLETIRDYAREKLQASDDAAATAVCHCNHYFVVAKAVRDGLQGAEQANWIRRAELELDNMRVAITLALTGGTEAVLAVKYAVALTSFWTLRGYTSEGRNIVRAALALPAVQGSDVARAHALFVEAALASDESDHAEACEMLETCLALRRRLGNPLEIAATLSTLSLVRLQSGDIQGAGASEREALQIFRSVDEKLGEAIGLLHLGQIAVYAGDEALAQSSLLECLHIAQAIDNREVEGEAHLRLGESAFDRGRHDDARGHLQRSLEVCREAGDRRGEVHAVWWLGRTDLEAGDLAAARGRFGDVLRTFRDFEMREELADCLEDHAILTRMEATAHTAVCLADRRRHGARAVAPGAPAAQRTALAAAAGGPARSNRERGVRRGVARGAGLSAPTRRSEARCQNAMRRSPLSCRAALTSCGVALASGAAAPLCQPADRSEAGKRRHHYVEGSGTGVIVIVGMFADTPHPSTASGPLAQVPGL